jgi:hypothetical protein
MRVYYYKSGRQSLQLIKAPSSHVAGVASNSRTLRDYVNAAISDSHSVYLYMYYLREESLHFANLSGAEVLSVCGF